MEGYFLRGADGERLLVIRSTNDDLLCSIIQRLSKMRHKEIKELGRALEEEFNADN